ncbi:MAG: hypothetical protein PUH54_09885 [Oscillospiraceae bacterium]|nr:hypothetical protein [Oscillospiraceae bacterium]
MEKRKKWYERFNDELFNMYNSTGESTAVHIVRDIVNNINTKEKWIDVVSMDTYDADNNYGGNLNLNFNWIIVELFPRITKPEYKEYLEILPDDDEYIKSYKKNQNRRIREENRYITWHVAHEDIERHRIRNRQGEKYIVLCYLYNKNKGKTIEPEYDYKITAISRISQNQIDYIVNNTMYLRERIRKNKRPTLEILNVSSGKTNSNKKSNK